MRWWHSDFSSAMSGIYPNTPSADLFLDKQKPSYIGGILEMANHRLYHFWGGLTEGLWTGQLRTKRRRERCHSSRRSTQIRPA